MVSVCLRRGSRSGGRQPAQVLKRRPRTKRGVSVASTARDARLGLVSTVIARSSFADPCSLGPISHLERADLVEHEHCTVHAADAQVRWRVAFHVKRTHVRIRPMSSRYSRQERALADSACPRPGSSHLGYARARRLNGCFGGRRAAQAELTKAPTARAPSESPGSSLAGCPTPAIRTPEVPIGPPPAQADGAEHDEHSQSYAPTASGFPRDERIPDRMPMTRAQRPSPHRPLRREHAHPYERPLTPAPPRARPPPRPGCSPTALHGPPRIDA